MFFSQPLCIDFHFVVASRNVTGLKYRTLRALPDLRRDEAEPEVHFCSIFVGFQEMLCLLSPLPLPDSKTFVTVHMCLLKTLLQNHCFSAFLCWLMSRTRLNMPCPQQHIWLTGSICVFNGLMAVQPRQCHGRCVEVCSEAVHNHKTFRQSAVSSTNHKHLLCLI